MRRFDKFKYKNVILVDSAEEYKLISYLESKSFYWAEKTLNFLEVKTNQIKTAILPGEIHNYYGVSDLFITPNFKALIFKLTDYNCGEILLCDLETGKFVEIGDVPQFVIKRNHFELSYIEKSPGVYECYIVASRSAFGVDNHAFFSGEDYLALFSVSCDLGSEPKLKLIRKMSLALFDHFYGFNPTQTDLIAKYKKHVDRNGKIGIDSYGKYVYISIKTSFSPVMMIYNSETSVFMCANLNKMIESQPGIIENIAQHFDCGFNRMNHCLHNFRSMSATGKEQVTHCWSYQIFRGPHSQKTCKFEYVVLKNAEKIADSLRPWE